MKSGKNLVVSSILLPAALLVGCAAPPLTGEVLPRSDRYRLEPVAGGMGSGVQLRERLERNVSARFRKKDESLRAVRWFESAGPGDESSTDVAPWDWLSAVAISPDGEYAAVAGKHSEKGWGLGVYRVVVDVREGEAAKTLALRHAAGVEWFWSGLVESLAFATDGRVLTWAGQGDGGSAGLHTVYVKPCLEGHPVLDGAIGMLHCPADRWIHAVTPEIGGRVGYLTSHVPEGLGEVRFESKQPWEPLKNIPGPPTTPDWQPEAGAVDACVGVAQSPRGPVRVAVGTRSGVRLTSLSPKLQMDQDLPTRGVVAPPVWLRSLPLDDRGDLLALVVYDASRFGHDIHVVRIRGDASIPDCEVDTVEEVDCSDDICPAFYRDDGGRLGARNGVWLVFACNAEDETTSQPTGWRLLLKSVNLSPAADAGSAAVDSATAPR